MSTATGLMGIVSDDFAGSEWNAAQPPTGQSPDPGWAWDDSPSNDCTLGHEGYGTADARATITVPTGTGHDAWATWTAPYLRQATTASTGDFTITAKVEVVPFSGSAYQEIGITAWQAANELKPICVYFCDNGTHTAWFGNAGVGVDWSAGGINLGSLTTPIWLRIIRTSGVWTGRYSTDGFSSSNVLIGTDLNEPGVRTENLNYVGIHAANTSGAPTFTAKFDYFFESSAVISPEDDAGTPSTPRIMVIT